MIEIKEEKLNTLLKERGKFIRSNSELFGALGLLIAYAASVAMCDWSRLVLLQKFFLVLAGVFYIVGIAAVIPRRYSSEALYNDILKLSSSHCFSLVIFKDIDNKPFKFLLKYDNRWKCWLFPYIRNRKEDDDALDCYVIKELSLKDYSVDKIRETDVTKYSVSSDMTKTYHHTFYFININSEKENVGMKSFKRNGFKYRWFSVEELKLNRKIMSVNGETVRFVEENY